MFRSAKPARTQTLKSV